MVKRALKLRHAIDRYIDRYKKQGQGYDIHQDRLSSQDWDQLGRFYHLLEPFKRLTKYIEGRANSAGREGSRGAIWESLKAMDFIYKHLKTVVDDLERQLTYSDVTADDWQQFLAKVDAGWYKLNDYYRHFDDSPVYYAAIFLHPNYRFEYFE